MNFLLLLLLIIIIIMWWSSGNTFNHPMYYSALACMYICFLHTSSGCMLHVSGPLVPKKLSALTTLTSIQVLLMEEILHQLIGSLSHDLPGFMHPNWCRISSINSTTATFAGGLVDYSRSSDWRGGGRKCWHAPWQWNTSSHCSFYIVVLVYPSIYTYCIRTCTRT